MIVKFTATSDVMPVFNDGYSNFIVSEVINDDGSITKTITSEEGFYPSSISFNGLTTLRSVEYLRTSNLTTMENIFRDCSGLVWVNSVDWNTSNIQSFFGAFSGCTQLYILDTSKWDTGEVTNMYGMFNNCLQLTQLNVSNWDTSKVTSMGSMFFNCLQLTQLNVSKWVTGNVRNMSNMFYSCSSLTQLDVSKWVTSNVIDMNAMFQGCSKLTQLDVSNWDTCQVTNMHYMFRNCSKLTQLDLSKWDTGNVTDMGGMFNTCSKLTQLDVSNWDTSSVTTMSYMFNACSNLRFIIMNNNTYSNINKIIAQLPSRRSDSKGRLLCVGVDDYSQVSTKEGWDIDNFFTVKYKYDNSLVADNVPTFNKGFSDYTYEDVVEENTTTRTLKITGFPTKIQFGDSSATTRTKALLEVISINTSSLTDMANMFQGCSSLTQLDVSNWDTSSVTNMGSMFAGCSSLTQLDLSNFDTSNVTNMGTMFQGCSSLTTIGDTSNWDTSSVTTMGTMFQNCRNLTQLGVSNWDLKNVTSMVGIFYNCSSLTQLDASNWVTSKVANMSNMFFSCINLTTIGDVSGWVTSNVQNMNTMFQNCSSLTQLDVSNWDTKNVTNMTGMFNNCSSLTQLDVSNWDTKNVANMSNMFAGCSPLTQLDVSNFDTSKVIGMANMFQNCSNLTTIGDVSKWDTGKVTNMTLMFNNCSQLTTIGGISNWDTSSVTNMASMFSGCSKLTQLDLSNWDTSSVTNMSTMFQNCFQLTIIGGISNWDTSSVKDMGSMFNKCSKLTQLDVSNFDTSSVTIVAQMFDGCSSLTQLDVSKWDTSSVQNMNSMFNNCLKLTQLDLSSFVTSSVTSMNWTFQLCVNLTQLDISNFDTSSVTSMSNIFNKCSVLDEVAMAMCSQDTINDLVPLLPTRTNSLVKVSYPNYATLVTPPSGWSYDTIRYLVTKYVFDKSIDADFLPVFNDEFVDYVIEDSVDEDLVTRSIYANPTNPILPTMIRFGLRWYDGENYDTAKVSCACLLEVLEVNTTSLTDMHSMFRACEKLTYVNCSDWDTSKVTNMNAMFHNCSQLTQLDLSNWDTSQITDMANMFNGCSKLTQLDVSNWDTSSVTIMVSMFRNCFKLTQLDLSSWNTSSVTDMSYMFFNCSSLTQLDLNNFDTSKVTNTGNMFSYCSKLTSVLLRNHLSSIINKLVPLLPSVPNSTIYLSTSDFSGLVTPPSGWSYASMHYLVTQYKFDNTIADVIPIFNDGFTYTYEDTIEGNVTTRTIMGSSLPTKIQFGDFSATTRTKALLEVISINTSSLTNMANMFQNCSNLTTIGDVSKWDTKNVTNMANMFNNCPKLTQLDVSNFDTSKVTTMSWMFQGCSSLTQLDVSNWDTKNVANMDAIFRNCPQLTQLDVSKWDTSNATSMLYMFQICPQLTTIGDVSNWDTSKVENMGSMFRDCSKLTQLDVSNWDTKNVTNMANMFYGCSQLTQLDVSNWDTSKVTDMCSMFRGCSKLTQLDVSNFDTKNVTTMTGMSGMFQGCSSLTQLDVSNWDTSNVITMNSTFYGCSSLTQLDVSNFDTKNVKDLVGMFYGCSKLTQLDLSNFDTNKVTSIYNMFQNCSSLTQLDLSNFDTSKVTIMSNVFNGCSSLTQLDVSNWDTSSVTNMTTMFHTCAQLTQLDLSNWDTSSVTNMTSMFRGCSSLTQLNVSNWNLSQVTKTTQAFEFCDALCKIKCKNYDSALKLIDLLPSRENKPQGYLFCNQKVSNTKNWTTFVCKDDELKLTLPQPLRSLNNKQDRLFWDYNKGHYCIEKNINVITLNGNDSEGWDIINDPNIERDYIVAQAYNIVLPFSYGEGAQASNLFNVPLNESISKDGVECLWGKEDSTQAYRLTIKLSRDKLSTLNLDGVLQWLRDNNITIRYVLDSPQIVDLEDMTTKGNVNVYNETTIEDNNAIAMPSMHLISEIVFYEISSIIDNKTYYLQLESKGSVNIQLGDSVVNLPNHGDFTKVVQPIKASMVKESIIRFYGSGSVRNVMLLNKEPKQDLEYFKGIQANENSVITDGNILTLENNHKEIGSQLDNQVIHIDSIMGDTKVNRIVEPYKGDILCGPIDEHGIKVTSNQGYEGAKVEVLPQGNSILNYGQIKEPFNVKHPLGDIQANTAQSNANARDIEITEICGNTNSELKSVYEDSYLQNLRPDLSNYASNNDISEITFNDYGVQFSNVPLQEITGLSITFNNSIMVTQGETYTFTYKANMINAPSYSISVINVSSGNEQVLVSNSTKINSTICVPFVANSNEIKLKITLNKPINDTIKARLEFVEIMLLLGSYPSLPFEFFSDKIYKANFGVLNDMREYWIREPLRSGDKIVYNKHNELCIIRQGYKEILDTNAPMVFNLPSKGQVVVNSEVLPSYIRTTKSKLNKLALNANTTYTMTFACNTSGNLVVYLNDTQYSTISVTSGVNTVQLTTSEVCDVYVQGSNVQISYVVIVEGNESHSEYFDEFISVGDNLELELQLASKGVTNKVTLNLDEPLRKIGDYKDEIVKLHSQWFVKRNISKVTLDENINIVQVASNDSGVTIQVDCGIENNPILCTTNVLGYGQSTRYEGIIESNDSTYDFSLFLSHTTLSTFNNMNEAGIKANIVEYFTQHPMDIFYVKAKPTYEELDKAPILVMGGKNIEVKAIASIDCNIHVRNKTYACAYAPKSNMTLVTNRNPINAKFDNGETQVVDNNFLYMVTPNSGEVLLHLYGNGITIDQLALYDGHIEEAYIPNHFDGMKSLGSTNGNITLTTNSNEETLNIKLQYYDNNGNLQDIPSLTLYDSIEWHSDDGKWYYHKRSGEVVLNGSENFNLYDKFNAIFGNTETVAFSYRIQGYLKNPAPNTILCDTFKTDLSRTDDIDGIYNFDAYVGFNTIVFKILKGRLATQDVAGFKQWLKANPTTVVYQLEQEEVYEMPNLVLEGGKSLSINEAYIHTNLDFQVGVRILHDFYDLHGSIDTLSWNNYLGSHILSNNIDKIVINDANIIDNLNISMSSYTCYHSIFDISGIELPNALSCEPTDTIIFSQDNKHAISASNVTSESMRIQVSNYHLNTIDEYGVKEYLKSIIPFNIYYKVIPSEVPLGRLMIPINVTSPQFVNKFMGIRPIEFSLQTVLASQAYWNAPKLKPNAKYTLNVLDGNGILDTNMGGVPIHIDLDKTKSYTFTTIDATNRYALSGKGRLKGLVLLEGEHVYNGEYFEGYGEVQNLTFIVNGQEYELSMDKYLSKLGDVVDKLIFDEERRIYKYYEAIGKYTIRDNDTFTLTENGYELDRIFYNVDATGDMESTIGFINEKFSFSNNKFCFMTNDPNELVGHKIRYKNKEVRECLITMSTLVFPMEEGDNEFLVQGIRPNNIILTDGENTYETTIDGIYYKWREEFNSEFIQLNPVNDEIYVDNSDKIWIDEIEGSAMFNLVKDTNDINNIPLSNLSSQSYYTLYFNYDIDKDVKLDINLGGNYASINLAPSEDQVIIHIFTDVSILDMNLSLKCNDTIVLSNIMVFEGLFYHNVDYIQDYSLTGYKYDNTFYYEFFICDSMTTKTVDHLEI